MKNALLDIVKIIFIVDRGAPWSIIAIPLAVHIYIYIHILDVLKLFDGQEKKKAIL